MLGWFRALMPREERFFELFTRHAQVTVAGAVALRDLLNGRRDVVEACKEISRREADADELTREVLAALRRTFITPLDRGDIKDLITSMDDAIDQMNQTAKTITLFELRSFERPMQEMGEIIVRAAELSAEAVGLLGALGKQANRLNALTEEIVRIEEQSDQLHERGRKELFLNQNKELLLNKNNAIAFVIGTEVYDHLEEVVDRFEDVASEISAIVIENV
jgi:predicted phosphate transport protein (TIGR00153 family)